MTRDEKAYLTNGSSDSIRCTLTLFFLLTSFTSYGSGDSLTATPTSFTAFRMRL